jgi:hypothetical protein
MPLSEFEHKRIEALFHKYCEAKVPAHVQDRLRITFKIDDVNVTLFECRPRFDNPAKWIELAVAKFRKNDNIWLLYCADRNSKWHLYEPYPKDLDIENLLAEVNRDQTGIFWG